MRTLYVLGNSIEPTDTMAITVAETIKETLKEKGITIQYLDPTESLPDLPKHPMFLDTVHGIDSVTVFQSLSDFIPPPRFSVHDFDLFTELSILLKLKKIEGFTIIGVAEGGDVEKISKNVILSLRRIPHIYEL